MGFSYEGGDIKLLQAFAIHIDQLRPTSRGRIDLKSADPFEKPALHFNYLATEHDRRELTEGIRAARDLIRQPAFDAYRGAEILPGDDAASDADMLAFLRSAVETDYHPCATCRMGTDKMAVVDGELRVHGIEGLRVVDASVMSQVVSANLNAPRQMIAARAADFILGHEQLAPFKTRFHFSDNWNHAIDRRIQRLAPTRQEAGPVANAHPTSTMVLPGSSAARRREQNE